MTFAAAAIFLALGTGPTVGDVGGCGRTAAELDESRFANGRKNMDCRRCSECRLDMPRCARACDRSKPPDSFFPPTCHPLVHDGEVCLRALLVASCADYASYVDDLSPAVPSECTFCRLAENGGTGTEPAPSFIADAAAE